MDTKRREPIWMDPATLASLTGGRVLQEGAPGVRVSTDTRSVRPGDVFVALRGARFDAQVFAQKAIEKGAAGVLVERPLAGPTVLPGAFVVLVDDSKRALQLISAEHRRRVSAKVIGITGSCGKTTTKDLCRAALAEVGPTAAARSSFNNQVGLPLTLLDIQRDSRFAVCEIGTSNTGEIARLAELARPDVGVLTCVREVHLEGLGDLAGVAREKSSLFDHLAESGSAVLNGDDPWSVRIAADLDCPVQLVSIERPMDVWAEDLRFVDGRVHFRLCGEREISLPRPARHDVTNALLAIAAGRAVGADDEAMIRGLEGAEATPRRLQLHELGALQLLDDTWNMSPAAAASALRTLDDLAAGGLRVVVFGEMRELGSESERLHRELGECVAEHAPDRLICVGNGAVRILEAATAAGLPHEAVEFVPDVDKATEVVLGLAASADPSARPTVLCKASRGVGLDRLVDRVVAQLGARDTQVAGGC